MSSKIFFFCAVSFLATSLQAQTNPNASFALYARKQDSLMHISYNSRDTKTYTKIIKRFFAEV